MIVDCYVEVKVCSSNYTYWSSKGYPVGKVGGRAGINGVHLLKVKVSDLKQKSNVRVNCICDCCSSKFTNRFSRRTDICEKCSSSQRMIGNNYGTLNKGKELLCMRGENHPRWNPNKSEFKEYAYQVRILTEKNYNEYKYLINPQNLRRTLCGVDGGYQLDHIVSVKTGFDLNISPEILSDINNLQMLPWEINRRKHHNKTII